MTDEDAPGRGQRRELGTIVVLLLAGGGLLLLAASRTWLKLSAPRPAPFPPLHQNVSGRQEFAAVAGIAVVLLLGAVLVLLAGRWARRALAVLLIVLSGYAGWTATRGFMTPSRGRLVELLGGSAKVGDTMISATMEGLWPAVALAGALLAVVGAALLLFGAGRWQPGLSRRFEAPVRPAATTPTNEDAWRQLDRGDDPTIGDR